MLGINYTVPCLTLVFLFPVPRSLPLQNRRPFGTCYLSVLVSNRLKSLEKEDIHKFCRSIFSFCIKMSSQSGEKMSLNKSFLIVTVPKTFQRHRPHQQCCRERVFPPAVRLETSWGGVYRGLVLIISTRYLADLLPAGISQGLILSRGQGNAGAEVLTMSSKEIKIIGYQTHSRERYSLTSFPGDYKE